jgi:uncharacterized protein with HEPN domain
LADITEALTAIEAHLKRGDIYDGLIFDPVRIRLVEIGEALKALPEEVTGAEPTVPCSQIARMRDHLAHRYSDTSHAIVARTVEHDLPPLAAAVDRLRHRQA